MDSAEKRQDDGMESAEKQQMERKHVFCVNGSPDFLDILRELLQEEQYNVTTTNFVPNTYDQIAALKPDLMVIDLAVGIQSGWELLERLTSEISTKQIPIIIFSTSPHILEDVQSQPERFGGQRFLNKPADLNEVLAAIDELIGKA